MKVYVERSSHSYSRMFVANGWTVVPSVEGADVVQFIGGADVTPSMYGQAPHPRSHYNTRGDGESQELYLKAQALGKPCLGICRGGQFLNVMNGGKMWQHVDGHAVGMTHPCTDLTTGEEYNVSSTHHQMMVPAPSGLLVGAAEGISSMREYMDKGGNIVLETGVHSDVEVVWYEATQSLCFQPHPEFFHPEHECQAWYFELIQRYLGMGV